MHARIIAYKQTGAKIEIFLLKPLENHQWEALIKPLKKVKEGDRLTVKEGVSVTIVHKHPDDIIIQFISEDGNLDSINTIGEVPLPPYILNKVDNPQAFKESYQTVYAKHEGAVAAPTAGLHFTEE